MKKTKKTAVASKEKILKKAKVKTAKAVPAKTSKKVVKKGSVEKKPAKKISKESILKIVSEVKPKSRRVSRSERRKGVLTPVYDRLLSRGIVVERRHRTKDRRIS